MIKVIVNVTKDIEFKKNEAGGCAPWDVETIEQGVVLSRTHSLGSSAELTRDYAKDLVMSTLAGIHGESEVFVWCDPDEDGIYTYSVQENRDGRPDPEGDFFATYRLEVTVYAVVEPSPFGSFKLESEKYFYN